MKSRYDYVSITILAVGSATIFLTLVNLYRQHHVRKVFAHGHAIRANVDKFTVIRWCALACGFLQIGLALGYVYLHETHYLVYDITWALWVPIIHIGLLYLSLELIRCYGATSLSNPSRPPTFSDISIKKTSETVLYLAVLLSSLLEWTGEILGYIFHLSKLYEYICFVSWKTITVGVLMYLSYFIGVLFRRVRIESKHRPVLREAKCKLLCLLICLVFFVIQLVLSGGLLVYLLLVDTTLRSSMSDKHRVIFNTWTFTLGTLMFLGFSWVPKRFVQRSREVSMSKFSSSRPRPGQTGDVRYTRMNV